MDVLALDNEGQTAAGIAAARGLARVSEVSWVYIFMKPLLLAILSWSMFNEVRMCEFCFVLILESKRSIRDITQKMFQVLLAVEHPSAKIFRAIIGEDLQAYSCPVLDFWPLTLKSLHSILHVC